MGDLVAQAVVFVVEFADALVGEAESVAQGCLAGRFPSARRGSGSRFAVCCDPADFVFEVGLGVEPGSGDAGVFGDGGEVDCAPVWSRSCSAAIALMRVVSWRFWAAVAR